MEPGGPLSLFYNEEKRSIQKKWVELFEKVIGRRPSQKEFMAGKPVVDLKQIQSIAGNAPERESITCRGTGA